LGDFFVVLFFGLAAVVGMGFLHALACPLPLWIAGIQIGFLAAVLIAVNNLRDIDGDRRAGKKTLAVRLGQDGARTEITWLALSPFAFGLYWWQAGLHAAAVLPFAVLPLAFSVVRGVRRTTPGPLYNGFLARAAALHLGFGMLLALGFSWR
jgi:1,4-dihydroxy-2-naphthoate octaprenyltransferase